MKTMKRYLNSARRRSVLALMAALALLFAIVDAPDSWSRGGGGTATDPTRPDLTVPCQKNDSRPRCKGSGTGGGGDKCPSSKPNCDIFTNFDPGCVASNAGVSRWAKWTIFETSKRKVEVNLDIPYRDDKGFIGETAELKKNTKGNWVPVAYWRIDSIKYEPTTGYIEFREPAAGGGNATQWYVGCIEKGSPFPRITKGRVAWIPSSGATKPGTSGFKVQGDPNSQGNSYGWGATAQYHPVTPPIDIFPVETPGALENPTPVRTIALKVCSQPHIWDGKNYVLGVNETVVDTGNGRIGADFGSCADSSPSTCVIDLKNDSDFYQAWGTYVRHGADTPGCDQVLFQVFDCFVPRAKPPGKGKETRYARIDLRAPLPYTVKLSCGSDYVVPEGVDPTLTSANNFLAPARRVFKEKNDDIVRSRNTAQTRLETRFPKTFDTAEANYPTTLASLRAVYNQHKNGSPFEIGDIIPMKDVLARIHKLVELGRLPAAEKNEMKSIETFDCPATKAAAENCVFPVHQYQALLPEIARFFRMMMGRSIYSACARDWTCDRDNTNAWGNGKLEDIPEKERDPDFHWVVGHSYDESARVHVGMRNYLARGGKFIYNFGCKLLSKYLPGMTKIEKIKVVPKGINVMGNWDEVITDQAALAKELGKSPNAKAGGASSKEPKPYEPPPREEVIEVCTVTHPQLDLQLKVDLGYIAYNLAEINNGPQPDGDPWAAENQSVKLEGDPPPPNNDSLEDKRDQRLNGETYQTIADRLMGFYRKGGKARVFSETHEELKREGTKVQVPMQSLPPQMVAAGAKNLNDTMPQQNDREDLRRQVDQWSDAWEYNRMRQYIARDSAKDTGYKNEQKKTPRRALPRLQRPLGCLQAPAIPDRKEGVCPLRVRGGPKSLRRRASRGRGWGHGSKMRESRSHRRSEFDNRVDYFSMGGARLWEGKRQDRFARSRAEQGSIGRGRDSEFYGRQTSLQQHPRQLVGG